VYNLHVTLKFIGEWPEEKLPQLESALRSLANREPISAEVKGLGWYPNPHHPRVFWAGVHGGEALRVLVKDIETGIATLGIAPEDRAFNAHLTLARIKEPAPLQALRSAIAQLESVEFGSFEVDRFFLFRSQPGSAGSIYTKLSEYPFRAQ
jgi:2'-5' RNA ligase